MRKPFPNLIVNREKVFSLINEGFAVSALNDDHVDPTEGADVKVQIGRSV
jgi:hypothetical protein